MKKFSAYEVALSALSSAIATIFLTIGIYSEVLLFTGYLFACIALMLPLAKQSWTGYILAYLSTCVLTLIFGSFRFLELLPFVLFFGLHPLVNELQLKTKINRWLACLVKALWFDGTVYLAWKVVFAITTEIGWIDAYILPIILLGGTVFFVLYDYLAYKWRSLVNALVKRVGKK